MQRAQNALQIGLAGDEAHHLPDAERRLYEPRCDAGWDAMHPVLLRDLG